MENIKPPVYRANLYALENAYSWEYLMEWCYENLDGRNGSYFLPDGKILNFEITSGYANKRAVFLEHDDIRPEYFSHDNAKSAANVIKMCIEEASPYYVERTNHDDLMEWVKKNHSFKFSGMADRWYHFSKIHINNITENFAIRQNALNGHITLERMVPSDENPKVVTKRLSLFEEIDGFGSMNLVNEINKLIFDPPKKEEKFPEIHHKLIEAGFVRRGDGYRLYDERELPEYAEHHRPNQGFYVGPDDDPCYDSQEDQNEDGTTTKYGKIIVSKYYHSEGLCHYYYLAELTYTYVVNNMSAEKYTDEENALIDKNNKIAPREAYWKALEDILEMKYARCKVKDIFRVR